MSHEDWDVLRAANLIDNEFTGSMILIYSRNALFQSMLYRRVGTHRPIDSL